MPVPVSPGRGNVFYSGVPRGPATSTGSLASLHWRRQWQPTPVFLPGKSLEQGSLMGYSLWGLESPSSTRLEALVPSRDSRARTRSPSPRAWRPDFPGAAREAP